MDKIFQSMLTSHNTKTILITVQITELLLLLGLRAHLLSKPTMQAKASFSTAAQNERCPLTPPQLLQHLCNLLFLIFVKCYVPKLSYGFFWIMACLWSSKFTLFILCLEALVLIEVVKMLVPILSFYLIDCFFLKKFCKCCFLMLLAFSFLGMGSF